MKKVVLILSAAALSAAFVSCKNDKSTPQVSTDEVPEQMVEGTSQDLALADVSEENASTTTYLYVTAYNGLSLREYNNLQSERLAKMPYGTKVKVVTAEGKNTMNVAGIRGAMDEIEFNHKTGFAFNGYLSKYFPPEEDVLPAAYAKELREDFPKVEFKEIVGGTASKPVNTETLLLPDAQWHEAYFIAQKIFDIPYEFSFPKQTGKAEQMVKGPKKESESWFDALHITRDGNGLTQLLYSYDANKEKRTVSITQTDKGMQIQQIRSYK